MALAVGFGRSSPRGVGWTLAALIGWANVKSFSMMWRIVLSRRDPPARSGLERF
jgi:hypothetical protein